MRRRSPALAGLLTGDAALEDGVDGVEAVSGEPQAKQVASAGGFLVVLVGLARVEDAGVARR